MNIYETLFDVVVCGGGPSGVGAAVAAARNGAATLLIERYGFLGGMATNASVPVFCPYSDGEKAIVKGIGLEVLENMKRLTWENPVKEIGNGITELDWVPIDPEALKSVLDDIVVESGVHLLLHTFVTDVHAKDGGIEYITVANKSGSHNIKGKLFIDCTGDADVIARAGGAFEYGDEQGLVMGVTMCFRLANVDGDKFQKYKQEYHETGNLDVAVKRARENNEFPFDEHNVATFVLQSPNMAGLNFGHVYEVNPLNAEDLTRAEVEGRRKLPLLINFLKKYVPGLENAVLASSGPFIGLRESRRILGEYRLTEQDYYNRADFEDTIARYAYPIDIHATKREKIVTDPSKDEFRTSKYKDGESYSIPYRALLPKGLKNILAAGRTISADRAMHGSFRVMPCCYATGEAAGTAAALCSKEDKLFRQVDVKQLQDTLRRQGAYVD